MRSVRRTTTPRTERIAGPAGLLCDLSRSGEPQRSDAGLLDHAIDLRSIPATLNEHRADLWMFTLNLLEVSD